MVPTALPFSPRPLGPLDTRRRRARRHARPSLGFRRAVRRSFKLAAAAGLGAVLLIVGLAGLGRAMQSWPLGTAAPAPRLAEAGPGVVYRLDLPVEYSARLDDALAR